MITLLRLLGMVGCFALFVGPISGGPVRKAGDPSRDLRQTTQARALLVQDPALTGYNIGVIVQDRVATLWGPVPSADVAFRAELCLRAMLELAEVRNELFVSEPLEALRKPIRIEMPPHRLPELLPPELPRDVRATFGTPSVLTSKSAAPELGAERARAKAGNAPPDALAKPAAALRHSGEPVLASAIRGILQSKNAYRFVQFAVQEGRVYLRSDEPFQSDTLQEIARAIARLPNVEGVIVLDKGDKTFPD